MTHPYQPSETPVLWRHRLIDPPQNWVAWEYAIVPPDEHPWRKIEPLFTASQLAAEVERAVAAERSRLMAELESGGVLVRLVRHEGYEDVHPELVSEDAIGERWPEYVTLTKGAGDATGT